MHLHQLGIDPGGCGARGQTQHKCLTLFLTRFDQVGNFIGNKDRTLFGSIENPDRDFFNFFLIEHRGKEFGLKLWNQESIITTFKENYH